MKPTHITDAGVILYVGPRACGKTRAIRQWIKQHKHPASEVCWSEGMFARELFQRCAVPPRLRVVVFADEHGQWAAEIEAFAKRCPGLTVFREVTT